MFVSTIYMPETESARDTHTDAHVRLFVRQEKSRTEK